MLTKKVKSDIAAHVAACLPEEACGLVVMVGRKQVFIPCLNVFEDPTGVRSRKDAFTISDMAWMDAEDMGDVVRVVHSHPGQRELTPSLGDVNGCNGSGVVWTITNEYGDFIEIDPEDPPLVGRRFVLGITDCYGLVMDWHKKQGVNLPDFRVPYNWWETGENLYMDNWYGAGFRECEENTPGAMVIMQISAPVPNHAGIYLPGNQLLHHIYGNLSSVIPFRAGFFRDNVVKWVRHKDLPGDLTEWQ